MEMPVHGQPFVSFPALDRADGSLKVRSDLLPGIQTIVSLGICKNGDAVAFLSWTPGLPGTLLTQVSWPEEWMMVSCLQRSHQFFSPSPRMEIWSWSMRYFSSTCSTFLPVWWTMTNCPALEASVSNTTFVAAHVETMRNVV
jgi:hypothetical protein